MSQRYHFTPAQQRLFAILSVNLPGETNADVQYRLGVGWLTLYRWRQKHLRTRQNIPWKKMRAVICELREIEKLLQEDES